jgi:predicted RNA-binding protein with PUA-like domain
MKPGDRVLFYHTGKEKAVVGEMEVAGEPHADSKSDDDSAVVIEMRPVRKLKNPVSLKTIKSDKALASWDLVKNSRLSVVPVTEGQWNRVMRHSERIDKK